MQIEESLDKILSQRTLLTDRFYAEKLFKLHPEFVAYFVGTDMKVQPMMLMMALQGVVCFLGGRGNYPAVEQYLQYLGTRHRKGGIPQELFPKFCAALLATIEDFHGKDWDEELASQWRTAIDEATMKMLEGYMQEFHI
jgi:hemoglobin-like flavoprotein